MVFTISSRGVRPRDQKSRFRVLCFDCKVRVEALTSSVRRCPASVFIPTVPLVAQARELLRSIRFARQRGRP